MSNPKTDKKITKPSAGRPTSITPEIEKKLESILKIGGTIAEATSYAGIGERTYYTRAEKNEAFQQKMEAAKHYADIVAKNVVVDAIVEDKDLATAKWWLEKREFKQGPHLLQQFNVEGGEDTKIEFVVDEKYLTKDEDKIAPESV